MKRFLSLVLVLVLALSLAACASTKTAQADAVTTPSSLEASTSIATEATTSPVNWPTGPVTIVVNGKAGSNMDTKSRLIAEFLEPELGKPVVVDNKPGAGGIVALSQFLTEKPNSNSMAYISNDSMTVIPLYEKTEYTPNDFDIVRGTDAVPVGLFVNASLGVKKLDDLKTYGKDKIIKFSASGVNNINFMLTKTIMNDLGVQSDLITDSGYAEAVVNVAANTSNVCLVALNLARQYVEEGSLIPLGVFNKEPYTGYVDIGYEEVPTIESLGHDLSWSNLSFLVVRAGTDAAVIDKLGTALDHVFANPDFQSKMKEAGFFLLQDASKAAVDEDNAEKTAMAKAIRDAFEQ